jgi:hypothetical protein
MRRSKINKLSIHDGCCNLMVLMTLESGRSRFLASPKFENHPAHDPSQVGSLLEILGPAWK